MVFSGLSRSHCRTQRARFEIARGSGDQKPFLLVHSGVSMEKSKSANSGFASRYSLGLPVSQGKSLHSCAWGRQMTFSAPRRPIAGPHPSFVVCSVRWSGEVTTRSTSFCKWDICGDNDSACFLPRRVRGASGTIQVSTQLWDLQFRLWTHCCNHNPHYAQLERALSGRSAIQAPFWTCVEWNSRVTACWRGSYTLISIRQRWWRSTVAFAQ